MDGYSEFYISCNPPLLPNGVSSVITDAVNDLGQIVIEVLYEPEVSWFKFISAVQDQPQITHWMHKRLERLLEAEVFPVNDDEDLFEDQDDAGYSDPKARPDVQLLTETPHVVPYPLLEHTSPDIKEQYDPYRYPDHIKHLSHKRTWQSPEGLEGVTVSQILSKFEPLLPALLGPSGIEKLAELTKCQISYNLRGSLLYIGSDQGLSALDAATQKLNTLASLTDAPSATTSHFIFTRKLESARVCYVWTTHVGLSTLTYADPECFDLKEEYKRIAGAVTLRIGIVNNKDLLIPDSTTYPTESTGPRRKQTEFRPFEGYTYGNKQSGTTAIKDQKRPLRCFRAQPETSRKTAKSEGKQFPTAAKNVQVTMAHCAASTVNEAADKASPAHSSRRKPKTISDPQKAPNEVDDDEEAAPCLITSQTAGDLHEPKLPQPVEVQNSHQLEDRSGQRTLVFGESACLDQPQLGPDLSRMPTTSQDVPEHGMSGTGNVHREQQDPPNPPITKPTGQNLMDMFDGPISIPVLIPEQAVAPSYGAETTQSPNATHSNIIFGKQSDEPKALFKTMGQKAAPNRAWAGIASRKNTAIKEQNDADFGQNVRVRDDRPLNQEPTTTGPSYQERNQETQCEVSVSTARVVPGMDAPVITLDNDGSVKVNFDAEKKLQNLLEVFQAVPGKISVEAKFGRVCIKGIPPAEVYLSPSPNGPFESAGAKARHLNDNNPHVEFYPILTTSATEANLIPETKGGRTSWCLPLSREMSQAFIHCAQNAWDVKLSVSHRDMAQVTKDFEEFAACLVQSLDIKTNEIGEIDIQVEPKDATEWCVERVRIHHEAKYRNGAKGPTWLTTTMVRVVQPSSNETKKLYRGQVVPVALPGIERVGQWFEVAISSVLVEDELQENVGLELGEKASWSPESLERHGAFRAICEPAIWMVSQMDRVGNSNANGHGIQTDQPFFDPVEDSKKRTKNYQFW
ncbi:hypothetical protein FCULG_00003024 [Fusarium culmorum]|uniref:Uncharacterized protein n=1 Tax=Fusarium culmorum TaxID=5516 RepID=A0A2T4H5Y0_FUSCU|nr:hypothetical protein FCULG_00003024 [Fusarium culmorum]